MTHAGAADRMIVIVASAGGVEAVKNLVAALPEDLPAAVVVALHLTPAAPSLLPEILERRTRLQVVPASDGLVPTAGTVIVARPDYHLVVEDGRIRLGRGRRRTTTGRRTTSSCGPPPWRTVPGSSAPC